MQNRSNITDDLKRLTPVATLQCLFVCFKVKSVLSVISRGQCSPAGDWEHQCFNYE